MSISKAERLQIENEMTFRQFNEKVGDDLDELDKMHHADGHHDLARDKGLRLHFQCECSDEDCTERIELSLNTYQQIHVNRDTFIVMPDHQVDDIETVVVAKPTYSVVRKNNSTKEPTGGLNDTTVKNS